MTCFITNTIFQDSDEEEICKFAPIWLGEACQGADEDESLDKSVPNSVTQKLKRFTSLSNFKTQGLEPPNAMSYYVF